MVLRAPVHIRETKEIYRFMLIPTTLCSIFCIVIGSLALFWRETSYTTITFFGITVSTGSVGIVLFVIGIGCLIYVIIKMLKIIPELGRIPEQESIQNIKWIHDKFSSINKIISEIENRIDKLEITMKDTP